jgi:hypothetical protein
MGERAADGAAMADLRVADELGCLRDQRTPGGQHRVANELRVSREGADRDPITVLADVAEAVEAADVDEYARPRDAELHRRDQRVPAGEHLRVAVAPEELDRLLDRPGSLVREGSRDHAPALAAASTASTMLW